MTIYTMHASYVVETTCDQTKQKYICICAKNKIFQVSIQYVNFQYSKS
jgi:hypothetical protein